MVLFGERWMNLGAGLAAAPGSKGSFFTGVLAVVVASPCTAPFMGSALGYALTQPPQYALSVFAALGAGMAAPMVAISWSQAARRWLPKPGAWMETLKQIMAFPLYLTSVWLIWVAGKQSGVDTMAAAATGLVLLALGLTLLRGGQAAIPLRLMVSRNATAL
jgi:thiol:disulfide interchange protein DsbD